VCLLVSEQDPQTNEDAQRLDEISDTPLTLRELLVAGKRLIRKRWDNHTGKEIYDDPVDPIQVAQQFLQEVLLARLI
jgi:hypothetical protein